MRYLIIIILSFLNSLSLLAQVVANAGNGKTICYGQFATLGGTPSAAGGTAPYTYEWEPSANVSSSSIANPTAIGLTQGQWFRLIVTDKLGDDDTSFVFIDVDKIYTFSAGVDTGYCYGQETGVTIGALNNTASGYTYAWLPTLGLDNPTATNPVASPSVTTKYTLIVSNGICPNNTSYITVTPFMPPMVDASPDTTIIEGQTITLNGVGSSLINWTPVYNIKYTDTSTPDVWPVKDTTYYIYTENSHGCSARDSVKVRVIKSDSLYFYSAFTPNSDGDNDVFYIGNLYKYPDNTLNVYNRYGKLIYHATNYDNSWDATYLGNKVPDGVYFYILDDGISKKYKGTVTIIR